jgi:hypothetical protein
MLSKSLDEDRKVAEHERKMLMQQYIDQKREMERERAERNKPWRKLVSVAGPIAGMVIGGAIGGPTGAMMGGGIGSSIGQYGSQMGLKGNEMGDPSQLMAGLQPAMSYMAQDALMAKYRGAPSESGIAGYNLPKLQLDSQNGSDLYGANLGGNNQLSMDPELLAMYGKM